MRQNSRDNGINFQRTGLTVLHSPNINEQQQSIITSLGIESMVSNKPILSQPYNPYQPQIQTNYRIQQPQEQISPYQYQTHNRNQSQDMNQSLIKQDYLKSDYLKQNKEFHKQREQMLGQLSSLGNFKQNKSFQVRSPDQIINDFKTHTLPRLRLHRLIKLQAHMKGYYVRKYKMPKIRQTNRLYRLIANDFLKNMVNLKIIPDIIIEVISYNKINQDISFYSKEHRAHLSYLDDLIKRVVRKLSQEVIKEQTDYIVVNILQQRQKLKPPQETDPIKALANKLIENLIQKDSMVIAKESIRDLSQNYLKDLQHNLILKEILIPKTVREVVFEALDEIVQEKYLDTVIAGLTRELSGPLASHMYELMVAEQESHSLDTLMQNYIYRQITDVLLEHLLLYMQEDRIYSVAPNNNEKQSNIVQSSQKQ